MQIAKNTVVTLNYQVTDTQGNLVDEGAQPLVYLHGGYDGIFPLLEETLQGKNLGEKLEVRLEPEDAFGEYDAELVMIEARNLFPDNIEVGMQFERGTEDGDDDELYTITDITDDKAWDEGFENGFRDNEKKWVYIFNEYSSSGFAVNTELVKEGEIKSVRDLLDPKWRGRMLLLDVRAGSFAWFLAIRRHLGVNALRQLIVDQQPVWTRDQRQLAEALVRGTYPVVLLPSKTYLEEFLIQGLGKNVRLLDLPESRVTVGGAGGVWLMNKAPHPNAAKVFINWLLTKEGQLAWNTAKTGNSRRLDVPAIDPEYNKVPGGTYFNTNREDMLAEVEEVRALVLEMIK